MATVLSAQCTDERVNRVTRTLFPAYPDVRAYADAPLEELREAVRPTGFFNNKARHLKGLGRRLVDAYGGEVPRTMEELLTLPGVARKTANVVLSNAFGIHEGVVVDTHVKRLANRMSFTRHPDPVRIERDLVKLFPRERWTLLAHLLIFHGRQVCAARKPRCEVCALSRLCPSSSV